MDRSMYTSATEISDTSLALATRNTVRSGCTYQSLFTSAKIPADVKRLLIHRSSLNGRFMRDPVNLMKGRWV